MQIYSFKAAVSSPAEDFVFGGAFGEFGDFFRRLPRGSDVDALQTGGGVL